MTQVVITEDPFRVVVVKEGPTVVLYAPGIAGAAGPAGPGLPEGGTVGQLIQKSSEDDYETEWTSDITVDSLQFNTEAVADPIADGQLAWNVDEGTLELGKNGVTNYLGQETMVLCRNASNTVAIPKGTAVMFAGTLGTSGRLKVAPMVANGTLPGYVFLGVTDQAVPGGEDGYVTAFGKIRGVNTSAYVDGDILWCDPATPGGFTKIEPQAPNLKLAVAAVLRAGNNGTIFVRWSTGARLSDLHDVESSGAKQDLDSLVWRSTSSRWEPKTIAYEHVQSSPSSTWTIPHNLGFKPNIELRNTGNQTIEGDIVHASVNTVVVSYNVPVAGTARLS